MRRQACTSSSPVCRRASKPQNVTRSQASWVRATGQPGSHVDRSITSRGAGETIRAAYPRPGSIGTWSGSVKARRRSAGGVGRTSPNPVAVSGRTRSKSHDGGVLPRPYAAADSVPSRLTGPVPSLAADGSGEGERGVGAGADDAGLGGSAEGSSGPSEVHPVTHSSTPATAPAVLVHLLTRRT